jgi:CheY-like chemotaxis protein
MVLKEKAPKMIQEVIPEMVICLGFPHSLVRTDLARTEALILVADDEDNDIRLLDMCFRRLKLECAVEWVRDGTQAIDYLTRSMEGREAARAPTVFLLDVNMPRVNGHEVLRWVRK